MHFEVLVEESSAETVLTILLPKLLAGGEEHTWALHPHRGKADLLRKLPDKARAYAAWMPADHRLVVLVDQDRDCRHDLTEQVVRDLAMAGLQDHQFLACILVEGLEAWYFGDVEALRSAYPRLPRTLAERQGYRDPDAIEGGTWERLDDLLTKHGHREGLAKLQAAKDVAPHMEPDRNRSRSFQYLRDRLRRLAQQPS